MSSKLLSMIIMEKERWLLLSIIIGLSRLELILVELINISLEGQVKTMGTKEKGKRCIKIEE
jgi:hypothetical protein